MALLEVQDLRTYFHTRNGVVRAVDGVSFQIDPGETLAIVGESGSGKSVTCYSLLGLIPRPPGRIESGRAWFDGQDLLAASPAALRRVRGRRISLIFQDPMTSLNPYLRIESQLIEPLLIHKQADRKTAKKQALEALKAVGIQDPAQRLKGYPHEFSGGMRQRVMIAMAMITRPDLLIADEPTTALDVTVQAQILELIRQEQDANGTAVVLISHDLAVVSGFCDRIVVMYAGHVAETGSTDDIFYSPRHPYTRALQKSIPALQPKGEPLYTIRGMPPELSQSFSGCPFAPRCDFAHPDCSTSPTTLETVGPGHATSCLRVQRGEIQLVP